jgi:hypothetical protein
LSDRVPNREGEAKVLAHAKIRFELLCRSRVTVGAPELRNVDQARRSGGVFLHRLKSTPAPLATLFARDSTDHIDRYTNWRELNETIDVTCNSTNSALIRDVASALIPQSPGQTRRFAGVDRVGVPLTAVNHYL